MSSQKPDKKPSLSREVFDSHSKWTPSDMDDLVENLFPENDHGSDKNTPSAPPKATEELLITTPGSILHLIDKSCSVWLASGDFSIIQLLQGQNVVAVVACVGDEIQWPLIKDGASVKVDHSHYFFSIRITETPKSKSKNPNPNPKSNKSNSKSSSSSSSDDDEDDSDMLNYGLTIASKGQEEKLKELDVILKNYSSFSVQRVSDKVKEKEALLDGELEKDMSPNDLEKIKNNEMEERSAAFWTTLAPNVEDYSGIAAKLIAAGSGQLIKGILWCGDVTIERMRWGNEVMKKRMIKGDVDAEISPEALLRIKRVKKMTHMTEKVATGVLSGVIKVSGFFTSSVLNSTVGKKLGSLLPAEAVLASLDGFNKVCDAFEVAGRNVMSTSNVVTTELVTHKYGEKAGEATNEGLNAAGYAMGTAWAAFKIRKVFDPKSAFKPSTVAKKAIKAAEADAKSKNKSK